MGHTITLSGRTASLVWGYRPAASLEGWRVARDPDRGAGWTLTATITRASAYDLRQTPLLFSVPRPGGFWVWPVIGPPQIDGRTVSARLGPPEQ